MNDLSVTSNVIPAMSREGIAKVTQLEAFCKTLPQVDIHIDQTIHAGVYQRTAKIPAGVFITGVEIKVPTLLIVHGHCQVFTGTETRELFGYNVMHAEAGRKQAFAAIEDTHITMIFSTDAQTVEAAEEEFTDDAASLQTRQNRLSVREGE